mmetsp:Transcript_32516/g.65255  ORF Transcript_32516/g.65255 Transcript_32516/m.65255 type:complete len:154 (+) Transcript_32516:56-517(+)
MLRSAVLFACLAAVSAFNAPLALPGSSPSLLARKDGLVTSLPSVAAPQRTSALESLQMSCTTARTTKTRQQPCRKECMLLKKRANNAMSISFSHIRNHKMQQVNLQWKRVWWEEGNSFVRLRLSTKAIKTLKTKSVQELASRVNLDLNKHRSR